MSIRVTRPFPLPAEIVMRCTLFALANMQARLQVYNEETGVVVATLSKWMGMQQQEVVAKVRRFEQTAILDLEAPTVERAQELLEQISAYVTDGAGRVQADATIRWIDNERQQASRERRQQLVNRARSMLPGDSSSEQLPAVIEGEATDLVPAGEVDRPAAVVPIPDNPGVLVKNPQDRVIELKVDPHVFADRTSYLEVCQACAATVMRGSKYCSSCGRPLTLDAVQPELARGAKDAAARSFRSGLIAIAAALVPFLVLVLPSLIGNADVTLSFLEGIGASLTPLRLLLSLILGILPAVGFGWVAISQAQRAGWYQNLDALFDEPGRGRAAGGRVLGWTAIYVSVGWILLTAVAFFFAI